MLEVVEAARAATGRPIETRARPRRPGDSSAIWADGRLARDLLGWEPRYDLDAIVATAWRWHASHPDGHGPSSVGEGAASAVPTGAVR